MAGKGDRYRPVNLKKFEKNFDSIFRKRETISDGFGSEWLKCSKQDCGLHVVRPGKVQCWCDEEESLDSTTFLEDIQTCTT